MKATWKMSRVELARVFAGHFGWTVRGNWIVSTTGQPVACGWEHLASRLASRGLIQPGVGVNWRKAGEAPRLPKVERTSAGYWKV